MNIFFVLTAVFAIALGLPLSEIEEEQWQNFKVIYGKSYQTEEEENIRKAIFANNLKKHEQHKRIYEAGLVSYTIGVTQFSDITLEEFMEMLTPMNISEASIGLPFTPHLCAKIPNSIDWRERGAVTDVKNQGSCGSCYAFGATGALEGQLFRKTGKLVSLSEQNLVDCVKPNGCKGGWASTCFKYVEANGGINTEESYPYEGNNGECRYKPQNSAGKTRGFVSIPKGDESALLTAVATVGPIAVGINAAAFHSYTGEIIDNDNCDPNKINHIVLIVGYGTSPDGKDYWIVKNSWGKRFGHDGYAKFIRNRNQCGIARFPVYPLV